MNERELLDKIMEQVRGPFGSDLKESERWGEALIHARNTIMNNLAIISGTLAAGSLVLLGSGLSANILWVVPGIVMLLLNVVLIFGFQFYYHGKEVENLYDFRKRKLSPVSELFLIYDDYVKDKSEENLKKANTKVIEVAQKLKEYEMEGHRHTINLGNKNPNKNPWSFVFMAIVIVAFCCISWGLLSPYIVGERHEQNRILNEVATTTINSNYYEQKQG